MSHKKKIGIIGYGNLGQYLVQAVRRREDCELAFVWNRTAQVMIDGGVPDDLILHELGNFAEREVDLIVEVAHPSISIEYGDRFLEHADYMIGSPTALADADFEQRLRAAATTHGLYVPSGALWGSDDVQKMADRGILKSLKVTMAKHPTSFKLTGYLAEKNEKVTERTVLYDGPVRELCPLAPNNVNTMAAAAIAGHTLGFDGTQGSIISDPSLTDWHIVEVDARGPTNPETGNALRIHTVRSNPARTGNVTGSATYDSFVSSMLRAQGKGAGVHLC